MIPRRGLLAGALLAGTTKQRLPNSTGNRATALRDQVAGLEQKHGGRLGVTALDGTGAQPAAAHRGDERFALCSTSKVLVAAFVLARVDGREDRLGRRIAYAKRDLVAHSPVSERHVGEAGLTVEEACAAAITVSDNTAENLLLDSFGGPNRLTAFLRSVGDGTTRLDRRETALNEAAPGDPRDTTTPAAMAETLRKLVLGTVLSPSSRERLAAWLIASSTGARRLRAGVPNGWQVGDKTGAGGNNTTNDVAVIWPPGRAPIVVAAYYTEARASADEREAVLAEVGRLVTLF